MPLLQGGSACNRAYVRGSDVVEINSTAPLSFDASATNPQNGRPAIRRPEQLRLHNALNELGWTDVIDELNNAARLKIQSVPDPILITTNGTILSGFGRWQLAILDGRHEINCIEYELTDGEALQFILTYHKPQRGWNAFVRIRLALTLEPFFEQLALNHMRAGGKYKGSARLPNAQHIDVRQEIASIAAVGARSVSDVKTILKIAHPRLIAALRDGTLTINSAMRFCKLSKAEQLEEFLRYCEERATNKVIRGAVTQLEKEKTSPMAATVLDTLQLQEQRQPGSVEVRISKLQRTVILVGQDLLTGSYFQTELKVR